MRKSNRRRPLSPCALASANESVTKQRRRAPILQGSSGLISVLLCIFATRTAHADHPQTYWDAASLAALQNAVDSSVGDYPVMSSNLRTIFNYYGTGSPPREELVGYAMTARILRRSASPAIPTLIDYCQSPWIGGLDQDQSLDLISRAISYDVLFDDIPDGVKPICRDKIIGSATAMVNAANEGTWWATDVSNGHFWLNFAAIGIAGQALEGEYGPAVSWQSLTRAKYDWAKSALNLQADGSWHEGVGYGSFLINNHMTFDIGAMRRWGAGYDADKTEMLRSYGRYLLTLQEPNHPHMMVMTHGDWGWAKPGLLSGVRWAARRFQDPYAQEMAHRYRYDDVPRWGSFLTAHALEFVAYDPSVSRFAEMTNVPLDLFNSDQQSVVLRDSWNYGTTSPGSDTIIVGLSREPLGGEACTTPCKPAPPAYLRSTMVMTISTT